MKKIKNIAIIAHVDHGKTTLVDKLLKESKYYKKNKYKEERIMDSNYIEKERGITILSKHASIFWKKYKINIVDTPGHADFGGEVERIMSMVDSVLLLVDALEGPMPQTRFVTKKAFLYNIKPIVVINKIDRKNERSNWVLNKIFDLFINLNATEEQLDFPVIYSSAMLGTSGTNLKNMKENMIPLLETIIKYSPDPKINKDEKFKLQISQIDYDNYLGNIAIGKIISGKIKNNQTVFIKNNKGKNISGKINKILYYYGLEKKEIQEAHAGEIILISGIENVEISDTICEINNFTPLKNLRVDKPTVKIFMSVNTSPLSGKEGKFLTSRHILNRLKIEKSKNVALEVNHENNSNTFCVSGRGELHLSVLIETMRREGFEMELSRPKIIFKNKNNKIYEPYETLIIDIEKKYQGIVMKLIGERKGELKNIIMSNEENRICLDYYISSRSLIGFRSEFNNVTAGTGIFHTSFKKYDIKHSYKTGQRRNGVLISNKNGKSLGFALFSLQERGKLFISHGEEVYEGQIIGIHNRTNDLTVNCIAGKKLTNMRASGTDEAINLIKPIEINLEKAFNFINDDELIEVTPKKIRIRKKYLKENERKKLKKINKKNIK
ncbi:translational GTPase TypA [Buchnera aphidicola (Ceratoglyphina bambusae)]|uniref:translational GTPase TypA n=1 Tax=Buchnera aphidicola TaxID=9 RepID=UPI0031B876E0